jgi:two-component system, cell cycle sensor histidine kinase and response regulator CckA
MKDFADKFTATAIKPTGGLETILLVEDDFAVLEMACEILSRSGYLVLPAGSERQALNAWKQFGKRIDLLLTDVLIPCRCTGADLARKFQRTKPNLRVVFMSGFGPEICAGDPAMAGGWFLPKPFSPVALLRIISKCLKAGVSSSETCLLTESELCPLPN